MPTKILIATPAYGNAFYSPYVQSVLKLVRSMYQQGWDYTFFSLSYAEIVESRNYLLTYWFDKTDATHILFLDADMGFGPDLILDMVQLNQPVVGAVYPKRNINLRRIAELAAAGEPVGRAVGKAHEFVVRLLPKGTRTTPKSGFLEVAGCGSGILLIQRSCIELLLKRVPGIVGDAKSLPPALTKDLRRVIRAFDIVYDGGQRLSEDYSFCHRWRHSCGGSIWAATNHEITHFGQQEFKAKYSDFLPNVWSGQLKVRPSNARPKVPSEKQR